MVWAHLSIVQQHLAPPPSHPQPQHQRTSPIFLFPSPPMLLHLNSPPVNIQSNPSDSPPQIYQNQSKRINGGEQSLFPAANKATCLPFPILSGGPTRHSTG